MEISFIEDPSIAFTVGNLLVQLEQEVVRRMGVLQARRMTSSIKAEYLLTDRSESFLTHYLPSSE